MSDVRPLADNNRIEPVRPKTRPIPRQLQLDNAAVLDELLDDSPHAATPENGEQLAWKKPGVQNSVLRKLKRGQYSVADTLDLHHMNEATARKVLADFLAHAIDQGWGCVRVIHGKGLRSADLPKLKLMTESALRKHAGVIAFASCRPVDGGTGATDALLKRRPAR